MRRNLAILAAILAIAGIVAGCGKKGELQAPPGYKAPAQTDKTSEDGKQKTEDE